ncbi:MAG TPA: DNA alkylation repair protein [Candidatus Babeliales bacterium]|nr:DNA alkylation repair protein [Candidatus Babeliales bacterium]
MNKILQIKSALQQAITISADRVNAYCKTGPGEYAEGDQFIGVTVPNIRIIAKDFTTLSLQDLQTLLQSPINEERLLALIVLVTQYSKAKQAQKEEIYQFYLNNRQHINNWNLVDSSAHLIIGAHLLKQDKEILFKLAQSKNLWDRRIAIVATWYFIRKNELHTTFELAIILRNDTHDLMHKAVGWMLREAGKRNQTPLIHFLDQYATSMPRTMLRYAIEKFPEEQRKQYLSQRLEK